VEEKKEDIVKAKKYIIEEEKKRLYCHRYVTFTFSLNKLLFSQFLLLLYYYFYCSIAIITAQSV